jgi:DNA invertase Pin-like site-specific DNA recombinase
MRPPGQTVGYVRVSSTDQNLARQLEAIGQVDRRISVPLAEATSTQGL